MVRVFSQHLAWQWACIFIFMYVYLHMYHFYFYYYLEYWGLKQKLDRCVKRPRGRQCVFSLTMGLYMSMCLYICQCKCIILTFIITATATEIV